MPDTPESDWSRACQGIYGLTLDELRLILQLAYAYLQQSGREMSATELRVALRKPGL